MTCPDGQQEDIHDTIHFKKYSEMTLNKTTEFSEFSLASNGVPLNPKVIATTINANKLISIDDKSKIRCR